MQSQHDWNEARFGCFNGLGASTMNMHLAQLNVGRLAKITVVVAIIVSSTAFNICGGYPFSTTI